MQNSILQNIILFQKETAPFSRSSGNIGDVSWVMNSAKYWPNSLIGTAAKKQLPDILKKIENKKLPPFWIMQSDNSENQIKFLESNGFREVYRWEGMWLNREFFQKSTLERGNFHLQQVNTIELLRAWYNLVQPIMLQHKTVSDDLLKMWLKREKYILCLGMENDKAVSAGMAFIDQGVAGIYFIATLPDYRAKGYASLIVADLIERCFSMEAEKIVLHSSAIAENMYRKMGFQSEGKISTFWKIGMF